MKVTKLLLVLIFFTLIGAFSQVSAKTAQFYQPQKHKFYLYCGFSTCDVIVTYVGENIPSVERFTPSEYGWQYNLNGKGWSEVVKDDATFQIVLPKDLNPYKPFVLMVKTHTPSGVFRTTTILHL